MSYPLDMMSLIFLLSAASFTHPTDWKAAEAGKLPPNVTSMVVGQGSNAYPPSINLAEEKYTGSLKSYLKIVKAINANEGCEWKDLGSIQTEAGKANLSQVDLTTEWGTLRLMHVIFVDNGMAYILTTAALKEEFPALYNTFFNALRSFSTK